MYKQQLKYKEKYIYNQDSDITYGASGLLESLLHKQIRYHKRVNGWADLSAFFKENSY